MERRHDDFERGFAGEFGVWINRDATAIIGDGQAVVRFKRHLNPRRMARNRLIHRIIEHFSGKMMKGALIRAADIHAGTTAHRLQPFKHLNIRSIIAGGGGRSGGEQIRHATSL